MYKTCNKLNVSAASVVVTQHRTTVKKSRYLAVFEQRIDAQSRFVGKLNRQIGRLVDPRPEACLKTPNVDACTEKPNNKW